MSTKIKTHHKVKFNSERNFAIVFSIVFFLIAIWPILTSELSPRWWAMGGAIVFLALGLFAPKILQPFNILWYKFGLLLGKIISPIVMILIYVLAFLPAGIIMRLAGKDLLRLRKETCKSFWIVREQDKNMNRMDRQF